MAFRRAAVGLQGEAEARPPEEQREQIRAHVHAIEAQLGDGLARRARHPRPYVAGAHADQPAPPD